MMYGYGYGPDNGWILGMGCMVVFGLIAIVGVVLLIVWAVKSSERSHAAQAMPPAQQPPQMAPMPPAPTPTPRDPAVDAARVRFAKGDISKKEFEDILKTLAS